MKGDQVASESKIILFQLDAQAGGFQWTSPRIVLEWIIAEDRKVGNFASRIETFRDCPDQTEAAMLCQPVHIGCSCHHQWGLPMDTLHWIVGHPISDNHHIFHSFGHLSQFLRSNTNNEKDEFHEW